MNKVLLIDDEADVQYSFRRIFEGDQIQITTAGSGEEGLKIIPRLKPDLVIMDVRMGGITGLEALRRLREMNAKQLVIMMTAFGTTQTAIEAMKLGAYDYLLKPFDVPKLKQIVAGALKAARDMKQVVSYQPLLDSEDHDLGIIGRSEPMQNVYKLIGQLAASDATALITGESGTGKELVARAIYHHSKRSEQPFLAINCAAIPENLLESELFGHERGAFTGATAQRIGKFEQCDHGTIFLDEIGDMSLATQTKMLRVLQSGSFERVGGNNPIKVDVRVIAATNKPLEEAVAAREFREDLFYRLNVVRVHLPPLRERRDDISLLSNCFIRRLGGKGGKSIANQTLKVLELYDWPGNVRELENAMERATVVAKGNVILPSDLPPEISGVQSSGFKVQDSKFDVQGRGGAQNLSDSAGGFSTDLIGLSQKLFEWARQQPDLKVLPAVERELVIQALTETKGNQIQAAKLLGITRATLRKRVEKFKIKRTVALR